MSEDNQGEKRARTIRLVVILVAAALALVVLAHMVAAASAPPSVPVVMVSDEPVVETLVATGRVEARNAIAASALVAGTVMEVAVEEGDSVLAGTVMVKLDPQLLAAAVGRAEAEVAKSRAALRRVAAHDVPLASAAKRRAAVELDNATRDEERARAMLAEGAIAVREAESARQALARAQEAATAAGLAVESAAVGGSARLAAEAALMAAQADLAAARAELSLTRVTAATPLVVLNRLTEPGEVVLPGDPLLELMPLGPTFLVAHLDEVALALVEPGQAAVATADAVPDHRMDAVVVSVAPAVDRDRGTVEVRLRVDAPPRFLRPEMTVSVTVEVPQVAGGYTVPVEALVEEGSDPRVYVVREDTVVRIPVRVTLRGPTRVQVAGALAAGDMVVVGLPFDISQGAAVAVREWTGSEPQAPKPGLRIPFH